MDPFLQKARPPYIEFEERPVQRNNPAPPEGDGMPHYYPTDFIIITPPGSKDQIELQVVPYLKNLEKLVKDQMFPAHWLDEYTRAYDKWKTDNSFTMSGTPVRVWPAATPAEVKTLLAANVRTVEDLAQANESTISRLGMGGRSLKQRAIDWFAAKENGGDMVMQMDAMRHALEEQQKAMAAMAETNKQQAAQLESLLRQRAAGGLPAAGPAGWPQPIPGAHQPSVDPMKAAQREDDKVIDDMLS